MRSPRITSSVLAFNAVAAPGLIIESSFRSFVRAPVDGSREDCALRFSR